MSKTDVVIVGGGISGFTCAITLAKKGFQCAILERKEHMLPLLHGFIRDGIRFHYGFHLAGGFNPQEWGYRFYQYLGLEKFLTFSADKHKDGVIIRSNKDQEWILPQGWNFLEDYLSTQFPQEKDLLQGFLSKIRTKYEQIPSLFLNSEAAYDYLHQDVFHTIGEELIPFSNELRQILSYPSFFYGSHHYSTPFDFFSRIAGSFFQSVGEFDEGQFTLDQIFVQVARQHGVELLSNEKVVSLSSYHRTIHRITCESGLEITPQILIFSGHPHQLCSLLANGNVENSKYIRKLQKLKEGISGWMLFGYVPYSYLEKSQHIFYVQQMHQEWCAWEGIPVHLRNFYLHLSPKMAQNGERLTQVHVLFPGSIYDFPSEILQNQEKHSYQMYRDHIIEDICSHLEKIVGDYLKGVHWLEFSTPLTFQRHLLHPEGSLYGIQHHRGTYTLLPYTPYTNLYLTGQNVIGPGLFGALLSGLVTSSIILGNDHIKRELWS